MKKIEGCRLRTERFVTEIQIHIERSLRIEREWLGQQKKLIKCHMAGCTWAIHEKVCLPNINLSLIDSQVKKLDYRSV